LLRHSRSSAMTLSSTISSNALPFSILHMGCCCGARVSVRDGHADAFHRCSTSPNAWE
jgi:hypothetical protein